MSSMFCTSCCPLVAIWPPRCSSGLKPNERTGNFHQILNSIFFTRSQYCRPLFNCSVFYYTVAPELPPATTRCSQNPCVLIKAVGSIIRDKTWKRKSLKIRLNKKIPLWKLYAERNTSWSAMPYSLSYLQQLRHIFCLLPVISYTHWP